MNLFAIKTEESICDAIDDCRARGGSLNAQYDLGDRLLDLASGYLTPEQYRHLKLSISIATDSYYSIHNVMPDPDDSRWSDTICTPPTH